MFFDAQFLASRDSRIQHVRTPANIGAQANHNTTFELGPGQYFHWHGDDDLCAPTYLERCADILDRASDVVLCHSLTCPIREDGQPLRFDAGLNMLTDRDRAFRIRLPDENYAENPDPVRVSE